MMLEGSKHIPDIYGYCTNSAVFDVSREGSLADFIAGEGKGKFDISTWTPKDKLKYAWQISKAMADVHSVGNIHGSAAISHTDISPDQFLWLDGMFKVCYHVDTFNTIYSIPHTILKHCSSMISIERDLFSGMKRRKKHVLSTYQ